MKINKKIISAISILVILIVGVSVFFFIQNTQHTKYKIVEMELSCSPDHCLGHGKVNVYEGVISKEECQRIGGDPIVYFGFGGNEIYQYCGQK